jgi:hypothetical protein
MKIHPVFFHADGCTETDRHDKLMVALCSFSERPLNLSDPNSNLVRQYDFPVPLRCRKTSDTVFVAFVCPLLEPVLRFSSCSMDLSQQIVQVVFFLFLYVFLF